MAPSKPRVILDHGHGFAFTIETAKRFPSTPRLASRPSLSRVSLPISPPPAIGGEPRRAHLRHLASLPRARAPAAANGRHRRGADCLPSSPPYPTPPYPYPRLLGAGRATDGDRLGIESRFEGEKYSSSN
uniref:Uncharacterized protein n=1 Tax=Leersia perrieri TaxID=77586 RepID=A0A0D9W9T9_9ORYZ